MGMEVTGTIYAIFETVHVSERFSKREFVLELADNPKYQQTVLFQLTGDRVDQLNELREGDQVKVEFSLRGREWRSPKGELRYFNSLDVWKVELAGGRQQRQTSLPASDQSHPNAPGSSSPTIPDDDIPFATCDIAFEPSPIAAVLRGGV